jgi:hypothetical protein
MKSFLLALSLLSFGAAAAPRIACHVDALDKEEWAHLEKNLVPRVTAAVIGETEAPEGYSFRFPASAVPLVGEWTWYVARCCPMVDYRLEISAATSGTLTVRLSGRDGVKEFIAEEFAPLFKAVASKAAASR